ncbi:hypothetical protein OG800_49615 (plasmid) [Streptomyces sp. NBC_00445]|uniref:hypothetical protein n=1 Tax=Streptomyces sp. NBC_00445 TaxID=2975745 RepID=UPI002E1E0FEA
MKGEAGACRLDTPSGGAEFSVDIPSSVVIAWRADNSTRLNEINKNGQRRPTT